MAICPPPARRADSDRLLKEIETRQAEQGLEKAKAAPGPYDLLAANGLGVGYASQGRLPEAIALFEQTLEKRKTKLGPDHPDTLRSMHQLAWSYQTVGKLDQADRLGRDLLERMRQKGRPKAIDTDGVLGLLGLNLLKQQRYVEAEPILRECLAIREKKIPSGWLRFNTLSMLGGALLGQKKYAAAEPLLLEGHEGMKQREVKIPSEGKIRLTEAVERRRLSPVGAADNSPAIHRWVG